MRERNKSMRKLLRYLKHYKKESIIGPLFKLLEACFELIVPLVMANIIDIGIKNQDMPYIWKMGVVLVLFGVLGLACSLTAQYFAAKAAVGFGTELRLSLIHISRFCVQNALTTRIPERFSRVDKSISSSLRCTFLYNGIVIIIIP